MVICEEKNLLKDSNGKLSGRNKYSRKKVTLVKKRPLKIFWGDSQGMHFMLPSAEKLYKDTDLFFQEDLAPPHTARGTNACFVTMVSLWLIDQHTCLD